jgi:hypothetical protein
MDRNNGCGLAIATKNVIIGGVSQAHAHGSNIIHPFTISTARHIGRLVLRNINHIIYQYSTPKSKKMQIKPKNSTISRINSSFFIDFFGSIRYDRGKYQQIIIHAARPAC